MDKNTLIVAFATLVIGAGAGYFIGSTTPEPTMNTAEETGTHTEHTMQGQMDAMMSDLEGKEGDEFDQAFLQNMIMHHEGAVAMAQAALAHSAHEEVKTLARSIIETQTAEIAQMKAWLEGWYGGKL